MKRFLTAVIILTAGIFSNAADLDSYRGTPLLCQKVEENNLPFGEFFLVRSYRNVTQLLVSVNTKIILYTDRDNMKDSEIYVSSYSRVEQVHLNEKTMSQHEFNLAVEKLIREGDSGSTSTIPFPGCEKFVEELKKGLKPDREEREYFIHLKKNSRPVSLMTINLTWKKLTLRNLMDENGVPSSFCSIYIDECFDRNIKKIIREYSVFVRN